MEILHTTNEEPFVSGTGHFAGWENRLMKLEDTAILFCREGHAHIMIDLQEYELAPNTQVVLLPDTFQEVTARLDLSFFRFLKKNPCVTLPEERTRSINGLASGIEDLYHDRDNCFRQQILKNYIQSFLLDIYDKTHRLFLMKRPEGISRQEELFKRFIQLVHKHCTTQREVSFYANKLFITPRYLSTVIQNVTNTTAKSIIDKHVILEIKVLLKSTNLSVQEISNQLCFPDQSFFGRYFKKHTGLSPLQYRNQN